MLRLASPPGPLRDLAVAWLDIFWRVGLVKPHSGFQSTAFQKLSIISEFVLRFQLVLPRLAIDHPVIEIELKFKIRLNPAPDMSCRNSPMGSRVEATATVVRLE